MIHLFVAGLPRHRSGGRLLGDRRANGDSNKKLSKLFFSIVLESLNNVTIVMQKMLVVMEILMKIMLAMMTER